jgi:LDH2 family malate/lactate/ureidoglycolate dehydrogenase
MAIGPAAGPDTRSRYRDADLREFTRAVFLHYGVPPDDAAVGAEVLIDADLAGIESHGIAHLPWHPGYAPGLERGIVAAKPDVRVLRESPVSAAWDGGGGVGVITSKRAMEACIGKAEAAGVGMVTVSNGRHFGAAGYYARMAAERDLIGMAMCNVPPIAVAAGGLDPVFGTNPIAIAAPVENDHPFLLDIATTAVAGGKLEIAQRQGKPIPAGWAVDATGADSDDPGILRKGGFLLPLGSRMETSAHKGYGLGLAVDIFSGILAGVGAGMFTNRQVLEQGHWFAAWRIDLFRDPAEFKAEMKRLVDHIRGTRPEPGREAVLVPGDPEAIARADRSVHGVPLDEETVRQLHALGEKIGVPFPAPLTQGGGAQL